MDFPPTSEEYNNLNTINKIKALEKEIKRLRQNDDDGTTQKINKKKEDAHRAMVEIELQPVTRDHEINRNSWAKIYRDVTARRKSLKILGKEVVVDDWLDWRVKWGQRGSGLFTLMGLLCHIVGLRVATVIFTVIAMIFTVMLYYKNVSFVITKRLLKEANVIIIVMLTTFNCIIEFLRPATPISPINGILYMIAINMFVFIDAMKLKSRIYVIIIASLFTALNINNLYSRIFKDSNKGTVLFNYTIQGEEYTIMKRSMQRSIFIQVFLFSIKAVYTMFIKDKKMELLIFATGNIYRETGTASKEIEDTTFSMKMKQEKTNRSIDPATA